MRNLTILLILLILPLGGFSQNSKFIVGFDFGAANTSLNFSNQTASSQNLTQQLMDSKVQTQFNCTGDLNVEYLISSQFSLKSGFGLEKISTEITAYNITYYYDYLTIPVLANFSTKGKIKLYVNAGPTIGFLLNNSPTFVNDNKTNNVELGVLFGIGSYIPVSSRICIDIQLRDNYGLTNMMQPGGFLMSAGGYNYSNINPNAFGLSIGFRYRI